MQIAPPTATPNILVSSHLLNTKLSLYSFLVRMDPTVATPISESSNITDLVVTNRNGVKGLSEMGLKTLPKQYIQPVEERITVSNILPQESIPIIDMSNWDEPKVSESICDAAEKWGFFQIINHGVPIEVLKNVKDATHRFFNLPAEEKRKFSKENSPSNSVRFGTSFSLRQRRLLNGKIT